MNIEFIPSSKDVERIVDPPIPAKLCVPDWYKDIESFHRSAPKWDEYGNIINKNVKMCQPFIDSMSLGYIQKTWCDIYIEKNDNSVIFRYSGDIEIFISRENSSIKDAYGFYPIELAWVQPWIPKTKNGYSSLICSPINHYNLPFETTSGVVDSDKFYSQPFGKIPFYIKSNFSGLIPMGTPMYQIIPYKRDNFKSKTNKFDEEIFYNGKKIQGKKFWGSYKKFFWEKKTFN